MRPRASLLATHGEAHGSSTPSKPDAQACMDLVVQAHRARPQRPALSCPQTMPSLKARDAACAHHRRAAPPGAPAAPCIVQILNPSLARGATCSRRAPSPCRPSRRASSAGAASARRSAAFQPAANAPPGGAQGCPGCAHAGQPGAAGAPAAAAPAAGAAPPMSLAPLVRTPSSPPQEASRLPAAASHSGRGAGVPSEAATAGRGSCAWPGSRPGSATGSGRASIACSSAAGARPASAGTAAAAAARLSTTAWRGPAQCCARPSHLRPAYACVHGAGEPCPRFSSHLTLPTAGKPHGLPAAQEPVHSDPGACLQQRRRARTLTHRRLP